MPGNLVAIYQDAASADAAVRDLLDAGVPRERIHRSDRPAGPLEPRRAVRRDVHRFEAARDREDRMSARGAAVGALVGAVLFGFLTVILGFLPGLEWILWEGEWTTILAGAAVGALLGLVAGGLGAPLRRPGGTRTVDAREPGHVGQSVVEVATDHDVDRIVALLTRHHPLELDRATHEPVEPVVEPRRRGRLSDVEIADRQTRDRDEEPTR